MKRQPSKIDEVVSALRSHSFQFSDENDLQAGIERVLIKHRIGFVREHTLGKADVIDFLLEGGVGIEVKTQGSLVGVARQLLRYARHPDVTALILVTAKSRLGALPHQLNGKPLFVVALWDSML